VAAAGVQLKYKWRNKQEVKFDYSASCRCFCRNSGYLFFLLLFLVSLYRAGRQEHI